MKTHEYRTVVSSGECSFIDDHRACDQPADHPVHVEIYSEPAPKGPPRRGAIVSLSDQDLHYLLGMPEGWTIHGIQQSVAHGGLSLLVRGEDSRLAEVAPNCEFPLYPGSWHRQSVVIEGKVYVRFEWTPDV